MKRTPIYDIARRMGASFAQVDGWLVVEALDEAQEAPAGGAGQLALVDCSARAKVLVEGAAAATVVQRASQVGPIDVNGGRRLAEGALYRLRQDRYVYSGPPGAEREFASMIQAAVQPGDGLVTVTDVSQGRAELWLVGDWAPELLSRLCGLDLHPQRFSDLTACETSVAKTKQLVIRADLQQQPVYALIGARSLGAYLWNTIVEAAHDLPLIVRGEAWLRQLRSGEERNGRA